MKKICIYIGGMIILSVLILGFIADLHTCRLGTDLWFDGFGRPLIESPRIMRFFFGEDGLWAGLAWFSIDMTIFWGGVLIGIAFANYGLKVRRSVV